MQTKTLVCLCVSNDKEYLCWDWCKQCHLLTKTQYQLTWSLQAATQLGKLACELTNEKCEHQTSTAVCGTYYILK